VAPPQQPPPPPPPPPPPLPPPAPPVFFTLFSFPMVLRPTNPVYCTLADDAGAGMETEPLAEELNTHHMVD